MAYKVFRLGGGLNTKAEPRAIPDNALTECRYCSFDTVGALGSARGRTRLNSSAAVGSSGSILGHFDGLVSGTKVRFTKRGADVYKNFTTDIGTPAAEWPGKTATDFSSTGYLTGFVYNGYTYMADGTTVARWNNSGAAMESWGLTSPGYMLLGASPITTAGSTTVTVTTPSPMFTGMTSNLSQDQSIEIVGIEPFNGLLGSDINKLHHAFSSTTGDVTVTGTDATAKFTIKFQRFLAATSFTKIEIDRDELTGSETVVWEREQAGSTSPPTNEWQSFTITGATGGTFRLKHEGEWTDAIAYNASVADIQSALIALPNISGATATSTAANIASTTTYTLTVSTSPTAGSGGGSVAFMRQGPIAAVTTTGGDLEEGRYFYAYTFYNGVAESNFSALIPAEISVQGSYVTLSQVLPGPAGTTERRIYRTDVNQRQLYYIGKVGDNTTTTFIDYNQRPIGADPFGTLGDEVVDEEFVDSVVNRLTGKEKAQKRALIDASIAEQRRARTATNLGLLADWTDHDPPPLGIQEVGILNETAFGVYNNEVLFSEVGNPEHWPLGNRLKPGRDTSETVQTWRPFDRDCIIYSNVGLYRFSQIGTDFTDARFEEIESPVGLAGRRAIAALDGQQGHVFLATNGLYLFDGARVSEISFPIEELFTDSSHDDYINPSYMSSAVMVTSRDRLYMSYGCDAANDRLLVVDFQDMADPKFTVYLWSLTALARERTDNTLLAGDASGFVYQMDYGYADNTSGIPWEWTTKHYELADGVSFMLDEVHLDASLAGASTTVVVTMMQRGQTKTATHTVTPTGRQRIRLKVPTYMKGEAVYVAVTSTSTSQREAYNIGFTYIPMGEP